MKNKKIYSEREVNLTLADFHDGICALRRDLVGEQLLGRNSEGY